MNKLLLGMVFWFAVLGRRSTPPTARTYLVLALGVVALVSAQAGWMLVLHPAPVPTVLP